MKLEASKKREKNAFSRCTMGCSVVTRPLSIPPATAVSLWPRSAGHTAHSHWLSGQPTTVNGQRTTDNGQPTTEATPPCNFRLLQLFAHTKKRRRRRIAATA